MENNRLIFLDSFGERLSTFKFYNLLLKNLQEYYHSKFYESTPPIISFSSKFFIDSNVLPLIAGLGLYLKKFHGIEIDLHLTNTPDTINVINFLDKSDFLYIVGDNMNPSFPIGKKIFKFDKAYVGGYTGFIKQQLRIDHKLRCYSQDESNIKEVLDGDYLSDLKRDYLLEYFKGRVENDFNNIFEDREILSNQKAEFTSIIAELAVNGIFHSGSPIFVMAQSKGLKDQHKNITSISVVDIGIGFYNSLQRKNERDYKYLKKSEIIDELKTKNKIFYNHDLCAIFETFCYSMAHKREGLFDLLLHTFINYKEDFQELNYFRIHNNSCQLIISYKFKPIIIELWAIRQEIKRKYISNEEGGIELLVKKGKYRIIHFAESIASEFSSNMQVSSLRLFDVEFPGVHIEVDIVESSFEN